MADIRDSIAAALARTAEASKTQPKAFAAATPAISQKTKDLIARAQTKLKEIKDLDIKDGEFIHTDDMDVALALTALEEATPPLAKAALAGTHKYDTTDPHWVA